MSSIIWLDEPKPKPEYESLGNLGIDLAFRGVIFDLRTSPLNERYIIGTGNILEGRTGR